MRYFLVYCTFTVSLNILVTLYRVFKNEYPYREEHTHDVDIVGFILGCLILAWVIYLGCKL